MSKIFVLLGFFSLMISQSCQRNVVNRESISIQNAAIHHDTIDFILTEHNNIIIQGLINNRDSVDLMFHTDAHYVSLTREALQSTKTIKFTDSTDVKSWGGSGESKFSDHNRLNLGRLAYDSLRIWSSERSGHYSDGKFGPAVLQSQLFGLNYSDAVFIIYSELPNTSSYSKIPLIIDDGSLFISVHSVIDTDTIIQNFLVHTGYSGTLLYDDDFVNAHALGSSMEIISESELSDSYGNKIKTKKAMLAQLFISDMSIGNIPIGFFEGSIGRQKRSVIGAELLKRFDLIFDIQNEALYLKRSKYFDQEFSE